MNKSVLVMNFFREIEDEAYPLQTKAELLTQSIVDYVNLVGPLKNNVEVIKDGIGLIIFFKPFDLKIFCNGSYKLFEIQENIMSKCYQLHFYLKEHDKDVSVLKVFMTNDNYIVLDVRASDYICDTHNENQGMRVFSLLLSNLYQGGLINI